MWLGHDKNFDQFSHLVEAADVIIVQLGTDGDAPWGLAEEAVLAGNPDVIYVAVSMFGLDDERSTPQHEVLAAAELGAMLAVPGIHRDGPVFPGHPAVAYSTAFVALIGILAAVRARVVSGRGDVLDVSMRDGVLGQFTMNWWTAKKVSSMSSRRADGELDLGSIRMLVRRYRCADGRQIQVHTGANGAFMRLMKLLGVHDRISPVIGPVESASPLTQADQDVLAELDDVFATRSSTDWLSDIWQNQIAALPVNAPGEVFEDPQVLHNKVIRQVEDADLGTLTVVAAPILLSVSPAQTNGPIEELDDPTRTHWVGAGLEAGGQRDLPAGPLDGISVLEMSTFFAAPYANRFLADLGAKVTKIETTSGDPMRSLPDPFAGVAKGKRSLALDMKSSAAEVVLHQLLRRADVVQHNFRPGAAERLGVDYERVRLLNPNVIYDYAPGYGSVGPKSMLQSFAPLHSGFAGLHTEAAGEGNSPVACFGNEDYYNGQLNAIGTLLALVHRERTGLGQLVECSQLSSAVFVTSHWYLVDGQRHSSLPTLDHEQYGWSPYQRLYQCLEGWLCVFCSNEAERAALRRTVLHDTETDPDAETFGYELFARSAGDWVQALRAAGVPCTVARETSWLFDFLTDKSSIAKGWATPTDHPDHGPVSVIGGFVRLKSAPPPPPTRAPRMGEHSLEILQEVGLGDSASAALVAGGV